MLLVSGPYFDSVYPGHMWGIVYPFVLSFLMDHMWSGLMGCCRQDGSLFVQLNPKKQEDPTNQYPVPPTSKDPPLPKKSPNSLLWVSRQSIYKLPLATLYSFPP